MVALVEERADLCREGDLHLILKAISTVIGDACLGSVGNDEAEVLAFGKLEVLGPVFSLVRVETAADRVDGAILFNRLAILHTAKDGGIEALLVVDHIRKATVERLDKHDIAVEVGLLIEDVDHPVDESPEEVSFAKLQDLFLSLYRLVNVFD
ncbi:hypothetical protein SDC9_113908 [bioreactor metagenome]|uniref:Uncharacterized protein n=1 Tax=bioreactor metagenome TaxID=1076179 RepID=A0A645BZ53_9ZZZZ